MLSILFCLLLLGGLRGGPPLHDALELVERDAAVAGAVARLEDAVGLGLVDVLHHLEETTTTMTLG